MMLTSCHDGRSQCGGTPVRIEGSEKTNHARNMRAGHRSAWKNIEGHPPGIPCFRCWGHPLRKGGKNAHAWCENIRLQHIHPSCQKWKLWKLTPLQVEASVGNWDLEDLWSEIAWAPRRKQGHIWRWFQPKSCLWRINPSDWWPVTYDGLIIFFSGIETRKGWFRLQEHNL